MRMPSNVSHRTPEDEKQMKVTEEPHCNSEQGPSKWKVKVNVKMLESCKMHSSESALAWEMSVSEAHREGHEQNNIIFGFAQCSLPTSEHILADRHEIDSCCIFKTRSFDRGYAA